MSYSHRSITNITQRIIGAGRKQNSLVLAIFLVLLGVLLLDIMGVFVKQLGNTYPIMQLALARNTFGLIPIIIILFFQNKRFLERAFFSQKNTLITLLRGASITLAQFCFYLSLVKLEFATASTLVFVSPIFVTALSIPILRTKVGLWRWIAVAVGFLGVVLIMNIGSEVFTLYSFLPIAAAFGYALSSISVKLFSDNIPTSQIQLFSQVVTIFSSGLVMIIISGYEPISSMRDLLLFSFIGILGSLGVVCLLTAYRMSQPSLMAPFEYFGIPFSIILGYVFFSELPLNTLFPGVFGIVLAGIIIIWRERKNS